jgi:ZIP family zinc transporter
MYTPENIELALALTVVAGLSTGIGSAIAYLIKKPKISYLSFSLGFSAGVMIYISFVELLPTAQEAVGEVWGVTAFFVGVGITGLIDLIIPEAENPHHYEGISEPTEDENLRRTGLFTTLAIAIHNFPEGLAAFGAALSDLRLGIIIALAIAIHNIPEGISVSMPIFYATGNRAKAFIYSFLSGTAEPVGAVMGYLLLMPFLSDALLASLLAFIAGIMVYISLDEILPTAHRYGRNHIVIEGIVVGMGIMAVSLVLL